MKTTAAGIANLLFSRSSMRPHLRLKLKDFFFLFFRLCINIPMATPMSRVAAPATYHMSALLLCSCSFFFAILRQTGHTAHFPARAYHAPA